MMTCLFFAMLGVAGIVLTIIGVTGFLTCRRAARRPSVEGRVVSSEVTHDSEQVSGQLSWFYTPRIVYEYHVDGERYENSRIAFVEVRDNRPGPAQEKARRFPVGARVEVFYDPSNPQEAVLDRGGMKTAVILLCAGPLLAIAGAAAAIACWRGM